VITFTYVWVSRKKKKNQLDLKIVTKGYIASEWTDLIPAESILCVSSSNYKRLFFFFNSLKQI
jgi:thiamine biosynthesis lipoprotein ApbE